MKRINSPVCSVCGAVKREANHWFVLVADSQYCVGPLDEREDTSTDEWVHALCSEQCLGKMESQIRSRWAAKEREGA